MTPAALIVSPAGRPEAEKVSVSPASGSEKRPAMSKGAIVWLSSETCAGMGVETGGSLTGVTVMSRVDEAVAAPSETT